VINRNHPSSDVAFTDAVKTLQEQRHSRDIYARMEAHGGFETAITPNLIAFLAEIDTAFLATANSAGQPYAQHRGCPKGFIRLVDQSTLGFADYTGNRQYITTGNLRQNDKAFLFLMDYAHHRRVKLWGHARVVENDATLIANLLPDGYRARAKQVILFDVTAWDSNCPQRNPRKLNADEVALELGALRTRIRSLEVENDRMRDRLARIAQP
jgi:predicted pyridoxine 5'-phosphate oxidase superfamily flavin-nucleotide-binding protein